jgi:hypothetical protein
MIKDPLSFPFRKQGVGGLIIFLEKEKMKPIVGFGALNLDLIFEVEDFKSISFKGSHLDPGKEGFGSDEEFQSLLKQINRFGTLKSKSGGVQLIHL